MSDQFSRQSSGHPTRQDNPSSASSSSSRGEKVTRQTSSKLAVESTVTRLLVSVKLLLDTLTSWSLLNASENDVSDVYVRLGNDFNAAVAAFGAFQIDTSELLSVPEELRTVLEQCLAEDASKENLEIYLPTVRQIVTRLLHGLRDKQARYKALSAKLREKSQPIPGAERTEPQSGKGNRKEGHRSQLSRVLAEEDNMYADRGEPNRYSAPTTTRKRDITSSSSTKSNGQHPEDHFVGGFVASEVDASPPNGGYDARKRHRSASRGRTSPPFPPTLPSEPLPSPYSPSTQLSQSSTRTSTFPSYDSDNNIEATNVQVPIVQTAPPNMPRFSLVDKPSSPQLPSLPAVLVEPSTPTSPGTTNSTSPPPQLETLAASSPNFMADSLAALRNSEQQLQRRASKRFSSYNITKMTGGPTRERSGRSNNLTPNRRSLAASNALTPGELAVLAEVDDEETPSVKSPESQRVRRNYSRTTTPDVPPVPPLPASPAKTPEPILEHARRTASPGLTQETVPPSTQFPVFLQLGREVKKVQVDTGISTSSLRVLFVDKFAYNPGLENFPAIYIRDPSSGVQYELEDTSEVKEGCCLSLNIEPLDQIKQHIDIQISTLAQQIKELKSVVTHPQIQIPVPPSIMTGALAESTPAPNRPTDRQFRTVARRLSKFVGDTSLKASSPPPLPNGFSHIIQPQMTGQPLQAQMTGGSVMTEYTNRVVTDLKTQFDEVQNLRRDLGIMRQLYTEFMKQTKDSLGALRGQTQNVKQLANASVGGARAFIDSGKRNLDIRSQNVLTEVEKLQDMVEVTKDDVLKRHITPKATHLKGIKKDVDSVASELESLKEHIKTIKPMWKKTWEEELQNIVEEQQFLIHQEEFLTDLLEDHKAVVEVFGHVEQVIALRGSTGGPGGGGLRGGLRTRALKPLPPGEEVTSAGISNVMMEIRGSAVDAERRMKAIEANQKLREKELASRSDDLHVELSEFVGAKKLKMTGGAEEVERVRQKRSEMALKAMFTGNGPPGAGSPSASQSQESFSSSPSI